MPSNIRTSLSYIRSLPKQWTALTDDLDVAGFITMIVEQYPELQKLSPERKLALADELFEDATDCNAETVDSKIVRFLNERLTEHERNLELGTPWSEVKARMLGNREA